MLFVIYVFLYIYKAGDGQEAPGLSNHGMASLPITLELGSRYCLRGASGLCSKEVGTKPDLNLVDGFRF